MRISRYLVSLSLPACFFFASLFSACAKSGHINYDVPEPLPVNKTTSPVKEKTSMFYGSYMDYMSFRAIAVSDGEAYRVVIMSNEGVKLQDMRITKDEDTDVYFYIAYMPKETIEDFAAFFKEYYFGADKKNIKIIENKTVFFKDDNPVLWIKQI